MDIKPQDRVRRLYNLSLPVQLQVTFVAWYKDTCYIRLADEISISTVVIVQRALEELMTGDCVTIKKARWSNKNDIAVLEETPCPLIDSEFSHMIIVKYSVNSREIDNTSLISQPIPYLDAVLKLRRSLHKKGYNHFGDYPALVKYVNMCTEHAEQNLFDGIDLKQKGNKEFESKNYKEAIEFYEEAKQFLKYDPTIWSNSSLAYQRLGENEQSLMDALVALKLDPFSIKSYHRACYALKNLKQYDLAVRFVRAGVFLCGNSPDFNSLFESIKYEISEIITTTEFLRLQIKTVFAIGEQATMEANFMRTKMFSLADSIAITAHSDHPASSANQSDYGVSSNSLVHLLSEVCSAADKPNALLVPHPYAFSDFVEDLFVDKLPPGVKAIQRLIKDANSLFAQGSYTDAVLKYSEVCGANNPCICKSEIAVLKYLSTVCNVMLVHRNGFDDDFRNTLWFARMLQEWLFTHSMVIQPELVKNPENRKMKKNCSQCVICKLNNKLSEDESVEMLLKTIPLHYLREVCAFKGGDLIQLGSTRRKPTSIQVPNMDKAHEVEFLEYMKYKATMHFSRTMGGAGDTASSTTENSNATASDCAMQCGGMAEVMRTQSVLSMENVKGKSKSGKQSVPKKKTPAAVKKNKNVKTNKKNKKKAKKVITTQQKQGNAKLRKNVNDSDKNSNSDSSSDDMADDENEYENECDMSEDNISLGYNPRKDGEMNASPDKLDDSSSSLSDSQMEILYEFMADFMNSKGPMRVDDPRLANYMAESFPENALSYVKSRSAEDFLVKSGKCVAIDDIICVQQKIAAGKMFAATSILNSFKNSTFFLSDGCKSLKTHKKPKYIHFLEDCINNSKALTKPKSPKNVEKATVNGNTIKKPKFSVMELDDFEDDIPCIPPAVNQSNHISSDKSGLGINIGCDIVERSNHLVPVPSSINVPKSSKSSKAVAQPDKNMSNLSSIKHASLNDDLSFIRFPPPTDVNNADSLSMDTNNLRLMSDMQEVTDELLKTRKELRAKSDEVSSTQKQFNELYTKLKTVTEEYNKFKLHQVFEMRQLEEDKLDLKKHIENEKVNFVSGKIGDESMIKTLRKQMDVLTFKLERSNNEIKDKNKLVDQSTVVQNELMKRLRKADRAYLTLKNDIFDFICNRELSRLNSELQVLSSMPPAALNPKIQSEATDLWQKVKLHISAMLQKEQKLMHSSFDAMNREKYNPITYDGLARLNLPDAHLALLFEQQNLTNGSVGGLTPVKIPFTTPNREPTVNSPARSPFSAAADIGGLLSSVAASTAASVTAASSLETISNMNRNAFGIDSSSSSAARTPLYGEQSFAPQGQGQLREKIKEIWQPNYKASTSNTSQFGVSPEISNTIVRPVPQLGTYHQAGLYNRSSPLDPLATESYGKIIEGYVEKFGTTNNSKEDITKAIVELKEKYRGHLSNISLEGLYAIINEVLTAKRNPWSSAGKIRQIWSTGTDDSCPICLVSLSEGTKVELVCDHAFHKGCLATWSQTNSTCPTCRKVIVAANLV